MCRRDACCDAGVGRITQALSRLTRLGRRFRSHFHTDDALEGVVEESTAATKGFFSFYKGAFLIAVKKAGHSLGSS